PIMYIERVTLHTAFVFVKFSDQYTLYGIIKHRSLGELMAWLSSGQLVMKWEPTALQRLPFVFLAPAEAIWNNVKVSMVFAAFLVMPYLVVEVWMLSSHGLHAHECRLIL